MAIDPQSPGWDCWWEDIPSSYEVLWWFGEVTDVTSLLKLISKFRAGSTFWKHCKKDHWSYLQQRHIIDNVNANNVNIVNAITIVIVFAIVTFIAIDNVINTAHFENFLQWWIFPAANFVLFLKKYIFLDIDNKAAFLYKFSKISLPEIERWLGWLIGNQGWSFFCIFQIIAILFTQKSQKSNFYL